MGSSRLLWLTARGTKGWSLHVRTLIPESAQISSGFSAICIVEIHCHFKGKNDKDTSSATLNSLEEENEGRRSSRRQEVGQQGRREKIAKPVEEENNTLKQTSRGRLGGLTVQTNHHRLMGCIHISICLQGVSFASCKMGSNKLPPL